MKILSILIVLSLLWLFVGCGGDVDETSSEPADKTPDVATLAGMANLEGGSDYSGIEINLYRDGTFLNLSETDASGNYSIGLKRADDCTLTFEKDGFVTVTREIAIAEGVNSAEAVTLKPGGVITGVVSFDVKTPDETQLKATIIAEASGQEFTAEPDRNGKYRLTVLPGSYTVIIEDIAPDATFPPAKHEGVEVKVDDSVFIDTLLSTWPYFEAEDATEIVEPMVTEDDPAASGGKYLLGNGKGYAVFDIMIPEDGDYIIWGRVLAKDGGSDSFYVGVNVDDPNNAWDTPHGGWTWDRVSNRGGDDPVIFEMSQGKNSITIKTREANTKLDKIFLTTSSSARP